MWYPRIAVGVVDTDTAWQALAWAVEEAIRTDGRLLVCHACPPDSALSRYPAAVPLGVLELADPALARALAGLRTRLGGHRVGVRIRPGDSARLLADAAAQADLLVLGAPTGEGRRERRSTGHRLIGQVRCPTVVVRPVPNGARGRYAGHVVVGVDGSDAARAALEFGFEYASVHRLPLAAVHATGAGPESLDLLDEQIEPAAHGYSEVVVRREPVPGQPLPALLTAAAGARLLVLGSRGRGPTGAALLGSVSHGAISRAAVPVAVLPAVGQFARPRPATQPVPA